MIEVPNCLLEMTKPAIVISFCLLLFCISNIPNIITVIRIRLNFEYLAIACHNVSEQTYKVLKTL